MSDINSTVIEGRLGRAPQVFNTEDGKIARFSLATTEHYRSGEEIKERVTWNQIAVYDKFKADYAEKNLQRGSHVIVQGAVETHTFDQDGQTRYATEIAVRPYVGMLKCLDVKSKAAQEPEEKPDLATVAGKRQAQQQMRSHEQ